MAQATSDEGSVGKQVRDVLKKVRDAAALYPDEAERFAEALEGVTRALRAVTGEFGDLELTVSTNRILVGEEECYKSEARDNNLAFDLFSQGLRRLIFKPGVETNEVESFVVNLARSRDDDDLDEDFVGNLWRDSLENIRYLAIDTFTDKIFMAEERFVALFREIVDDVVPGLVELPEDDAADRQPRPRTELDGVDAVEQAENAHRKLRHPLEDEAVAVAGTIEAAEQPRAAYDHLVHLLACLVVKEPSPLPADELPELVVRALGGYLRAKDWEGFAIAARTLQTMARDGGFAP
ncbi:MAG: hypothetical protein KC583_22540, partial [Myxococcales bacterium]|nr:hypothetical protein [Myxococcales bacterium]